MSYQKRPIYEFEAFRLDVADRLLSREGKTIPLQPKVFDLLLALVERHGRLVEKEELMETVWPDTFVEESNIAANISILRKTLGENGQQFIETAPKRGYRFVAQVRDVNGAGDLVGEERIVYKSLEEDPAIEDQSVVDLSFALETQFASSGSRAETSVVAAEALKNVGKLWPPSKMRLAGTVATIFLIGLFASIPFLFNRLRHGPDAGANTSRFTITLPEMMVGADCPVLSPDGRNLIFKGGYEGKSFLWLRPLESLTAQRMPGTEGARWFPFWSPDSRSVGFFVGNKLKKVDLAGGPPQTLCDLPDFSAGIGSWGPNGTILFSGLNGIIYRVSAEGGAPTVITPLDGVATKTLPAYPFFLPDGRHFLYLVTGEQQEESWIYLASLDGKETKCLMPSDSNAIYSTTAAGRGYLFFAREGALLAQPFDADRLTLTGKSFSIPLKARIVLNFRHGEFSISDTGILVYAQNGEFENQQLAWYDRSGKQLELIGTVGDLAAPRLSPDGKRVAVARRDLRTGVRNLHVVDLQRHTDLQLTFDTAEISPYCVWSPDGNRIVWTSTRGGKSRLYQKLANGAGKDEILLQANMPLLVTHWSADGRYIFYNQLDSKNGYDLWILPLYGDRQPFPFMQTSFSESGAQLSPDGRWIAYHSNESGRYEVFVQTFPVSGSKWQVSNGGGMAQRWRGDGKELFYSSADKKMMAVEVTPAGAFKASLPKTLFDLSVAKVLLGTSFSVTSDGQRFLLVSQKQDTTSPQLAVVINWAAELGR